MIQCTVSISLLFLMAIINGILASRICNSSSEIWQPRIGILVSPIISGSKSHEIEIYWNNLNIQSGDKISLYEEHTPGHSIVVYTAIPNGPNVRQKTGIFAEFTASSNLSFVQECTKYRVAWLTGQNIKMIDCLKTNPTWMKDRQHILGSLRMSQVFLPGTHDSASYDQTRKTDIISSFAVTQDIDILGQLIHGVRYLDIRVGRYPETEEIWWTNHGPFYRSVSLKTVIDQVKKFLDNTEEIVILDIREFPIGFHGTREHRDLVLYLEDEFRDYYLPNDYGWNIKLKDIWSTGKRLIIGYENSWVVSIYNSTWPCVWHQWGNVRSIQDLYRYLNRSEGNDRGDRLRPRSAMAELTANLNDILFNRLGNLRDMAYKVNLNVTNWYGTIWQYSANIVAVDFVRGTDIVEIAIKSNENRHLHCRY